MIRKGLVVRREKIDEQVKNFLTLQSSSKRDPYSEIFNFERGKSRQEGGLCSLHSYLTLDRRLTADLREEERGEKRKKKEEREEKEKEEERLKRRRR